MIHKDFIPNGDSNEVLKYFENVYNFSRYDDLIYFITWDLENVKSFDEKIRVKFGKSNGSFEKRWSDYSTHSTIMPYLIAVITIPQMENYKLYFPKTDYKNCPNTHTEENKIKNLFKNRKYFGKSSEKIKISINEVCDYFEKRQKEINDMYEKYNEEEKMWRIPFMGSDNKWHNRVLYFNELDKIESNSEINCNSCKGTGEFYKRGKGYPKFFPCKPCNGTGKIIEPINDKIALEKSIIRDVNLKDLTFLKDLNSDDPKIYEKYLTKK